MLCVICRGNNGWFKDPEIKQPTQHLKVTDTIQVHAVDLNSIEDVISLLTENGETMLFLTFAPGEKYPRIEIASDVRDLL